MSAPVRPQVEILANLAGRTLEQDRKGGIARRSRNDRAGSGERMERPFKAPTALAWALRAWGFWMLAVKGCSASGRALFAVDTCKHECLPSENGQRDLFRNLPQPLVRAASLAGSR